jgi:hypothetical protein
VFVFVTECASYLSALALSIVLLVVVTLIWQIYPILRVRDISGSGLRELHWVFYYLYLLVTYYLNSSLKIVNQCY